MKAMILSAGFGTRLWPLTIDRAKAAIPFLERPLIENIVAYLVRQGWPEIITNLHHCPESIRGSLGDGSNYNARVQYIDEPEILGTGGALYNARGFLSTGTFVAINGKIVTDFDLGEALRFHRSERALATLILKENTEGQPFTEVKVDGNRITGFVPFLASDNKRTPLFFTGIQILEPQIFSFIPPNVFSHTTTSAYPKAIQNNQKILAHIQSGTWHDISTPQNYLRAALPLLHAQKRTFSAGNESIIKSGANIYQSVLWDNVCVGENVNLKRCIVGSGVQIEEGQSFHHAVIVRSDLVRNSDPPAKAKRGTVEGKNYVVSLQE